MDRPPVVYPGDEYYVPKTNTTVVNSKGDYDLIVDISDITDDKNATIRVTVPSDATGNVTMTVTGEDYNITVNGTIKDGVAEITLPILPAGKYNITTTYPSDDKYAQKTDIEEVISKITDYDMNVTVIEPEKFGENATIIVEVPGETYTGTINNGSAEITLPVLPAGKHDITVDYAGDDNYAPKTNTTSVVSKKTGYDMNVTVVDPGIGGNKTIIVDLPENATGNVTVTIDGNKTITVPVINGTANVTLPVLPEGKHNITVDFVMINTLINKITKQLLLKEIMI